MMTTFPFYSSNFRSRNIIWPQYHYGIASVKNLFPCCEEKDYGNLTVSAKENSKEACCDTMKTGFPDR